jgi:hypothetical protein
LLCSSEYVWNDDEETLKKEAKEEQKIEVKIINMNKEKNVYEFFGTKYSNIIRLELF